MFTSMLIQIIKKTHSFIMFDFFTNFNRPLLFIELIYIFSLLVLLSKVILVILLSLPLLLLIILVSLLTYFWILYWKSFSILIINTSITFLFLVFIALVIIVFFKTKLFFILVIVLVSLSHSSIMTEYTLVSFVASSLCKKSTG